MNWPIFCIVVTIVYIFGFYHGAKWLKYVIERDCKVKLESKMTIKPETITLRIPVEPKHEDNSERGAAARQ